MHFLEIGFHNVVNHKNSKSKFVTLQCFQLYTKLNPFQILSNFQKKIIVEYTHKSQIKKILSFNYEIISSSWGKCDEFSCFMWPVKQILIYTFDLGNFILWWLNNFWKLRWLRPINNDWSMIAKIEIFLKIGKET